MLALTSNEWAMLVIGIILIAGFLHSRARRKRKSYNLRNKVTQKLYKQALDAQSESITGVNTSIIKGSGLNDFRMPMDFQDPTKMYTHSVLAEMSQRDYLKENEFLIIDEHSEK